jgi:hypothetical protein
LARKYPRIQAQFKKVDKDGYEVAGRHPFDVWMSNKNPVKSEEVPEAQLSVETLLRCAEINVNSLNKIDRNLILEHWKAEVREDGADLIFESVQSAEVDRRFLSLIHDNVDRRVLQTAVVIGVTTTGLARRIATLKHVKCKVVICEEAGEVLEPHILSALLPSVEHFVQIGDHQQLRPQINNYGLSLENQRDIPYQLDRSQFEMLSVGELGRPSLPVAQLNVQRRMRPEISRLVRETIYPCLIDHNTIKALPGVVGMRQNAFWLDHGNLEHGTGLDVHQKSHINLWEVEMTQSLVRHIVRQGVYGSGDIAALTPYTGQLQKLRAKMRSGFEIVLTDRDEEELAKAGFSNEEPVPEIEKTNAVSKSGNKPLEKKKLTELLRLPTVDNLQGEEAKIIIVDRRLSGCGHRCQARCHSDSMHQVFSCPQPCQRLHSPCNHGCQKATCSKDCGLCMIKLNNVPLPCGHLKDNVPCHQSQDPSRIRCNALVAKKVPERSHIIQTKCWQDVKSATFSCSTVCGTNLTCGHECPGTCGRCRQKDVNNQAIFRHSTCTKICGRRMATCNHTCPRTCRDGEECGPCLLPCEVRHLELSIVFSLVEDRVSPYTENNGDGRVDLLEMKTYKTYKEIDVNETPIIALGCSHFFTAESLHSLIGMGGIYVMDGYGEFTGLKVVSNELARSIPHCPDCRKPVKQQTAHRYNRVVIRAVIDEMSKRFHVDGQQELRALEQRAAILEKSLETSRPKFLNYVRPLSAILADTAVTPAKIREIEKELRECHSHSTGLQRAIQSFCSKAANTSQPARKLLDAAVQASRLRSIGELMANLTVIEAVPFVPRDRRATLGGRIMQIKMDHLILEDKFALVQAFKSSAHTSSMRIPGENPGQLAKPFFAICKVFISDCLLENLPKLSVETTLSYAKIAHLYESCCQSNESDIDTASEHINFVRELLDKANELCNHGFQNADTLRTAVEGLIKLLQKPWYAVVTAAELAAIKAAMVSGSSGIVTYSGHWYNCTNGHPVST